MKTAEARREFARLRLDRRQAGEHAKAEALAANDTDQQRLKSLAEEIATLDATVDPENLAAIESLIAKREQLALLKVKFAADAEARLASVKKGAGVPLVGSFEELVTAELDSIVDALQPFCRDRATALKVAEQTDSGAVLARFRVLERSFGGVSSPDYYRFLECIAAGRPVWEW